MNYSAAPELDVNNEFRHIMSLSPTPVTIVTAMSDGLPGAVVIGSFVSVSLDPPLVGFFVGRSTQMWHTMSGADAFCVNILAEDQAPLSRLFVSYDVDRFGTVDWESGTNGAPALADVVAWVEGTLHSVTDAGDHELILLEVDRLKQGRRVNPLIYHHGRYAGVSQPT